MATLTVSLNTLCLLTVLICCFLGRKDGEGGIMFDDENEKERWEEDQKVIVNSDLF